MSARSRRRNRPKAEERTEPDVPSVPPDGGSAPPPPAGPQPWQLAIAIVAIAGAGLLVLALGFHRVADYFTETDFLGGYVEGARTIQAGHLLAARYQVIGPVYELVLALAGFATRDIELAGKLLAVASACAVLALWYRIVAARAGEAAGLWTTALLAVNPVLVRYGSSTTADTLAVAMQAAALLALMGGAKPARAFWGGLLLGLAVLTRYNAIVLLPAFLWSGPWRQRTPGASRGRIAARYLAGFALPVVPWLAFSLMAGHVPGQSLFHNLAFDVFARPAGISWDEYESRIAPGFGSLADVLGRDPGAVLGRLARNAWEHAWLDAQRLLHAPAAIACGLALPLALARGGARRLLPLWTCGVLLYVGLLPVFHSERYSLALAPFYLLAVGAAVASPALDVRLPGFRVPLKAVLALVVLAATAWNTVQDERYVLASLPAETRAAAAALRPLARPGSRVLARKPHVGFYAGVRQIPFPIVSSLPELAAYCARAHVDFVFYSEPEAALRPEFTFLLDPQADVPGLRPIPFPSARPARLYHVEPGFGAMPAWFDDDSVRAARVTRALASVGSPAWRAALINSLYAIQLGHFTAAIPHLAVLTRLRPDLEQGFYLSGEALRGMGRPRDAAVAYQRACALDPQDPAPWVRLGMVRLAVGDVTGAADAWRPVVGRIQDPEVLRGMEAVFTRVGDLESARIARTAAGATPSPGAR